MIYFIAKPDRSLIKIGLSFQLSTRLAQLNSEHGDGLEVLAVMDGSYEEETDIHRQFSHLRRGGEWFEPASDLMDFIAIEGRPWSPGTPSYIDEKSVKIDRGIANKASIVVKDRKISMAEYLSSLLEYPVDMDVLEVMKKMEPKPKKGD